MRKSIFAALSIACTAGIVQGGPVHFTFDGGGLASGNGDIKISQYMSSLYPSWVLVNGAEVSTGAGFSSDLYLWTRLQLVNPGNIRILLDVPTISVSFDGYIFDATSGADFTFTAYNGIGQVIYQQSWNTGSGTGFFFSTGPLPQAAYSLNFSNAGRHDIGIDNLTLTPIPAPGAGLLAVFGAAFVRGLHRRRTL